MSARLRGTRPGFTLLELLVVAAILALLAVALVSTLAASGKCGEIRNEIKNTISECQTVISGDGGAQKVADCIARGQKALDKWCAEGCGKLPATIVAAIDEANVEIKAYRDKQELQADKDKIVDLKKPC